MAKKILLLDTGNEWGGGTNSMFELLKRINRQQFEVTCLFYHDYPKGEHSSLRKELAAIGIPLKLIQSPRQPQWAKYLKELIRGITSWNKPLRQQWLSKVERAWRIQPNAQRIAEELRAGHYDLLYMNNQPRSNLEGYLAAEAVGIPVVQHCRIEPVMAKEEVELVNRVATRVIGVSNGVVDALLSAGVTPEKCLAVLNGIDPAQSLPGRDQARQLLGLAEQDVVFGAVGQLIERKGLRYLLEATATLVKQGLPIKVVLVGDGPQRAELQQLVDKLGLASRVIFTGFQPQPLVYMAAMDVGVLVSRSEGLPRVLLEGMLLGLPVIATRVVGSQELVEDGKTGCLVPYANSAELSQAMLQLAMNPTVRQQYGNAGKNRVMAHYTIDQYVQGVQQVLALAMEQ